MLFVAIIFGLIGYSSSDLDIAIIEEMSAAKKTISTYKCLSDSRIILTNYFHILKRILSNLDNSELLRCKRVCSFWRKIANEIMSERIIIIYRNIPYRMTRKAVALPNSLLCLDFQLKQKAPFLVEFNLNCITYKYADFLRLDTMEINHINCSIITQIAIFPKVPEIKVHRFFFYRKFFFFDIEKEITYLTEKINVPKEELKCILLFYHDNIRNKSNLYLDLGIPSLILGDSHRDYKFDPTVNFAIIFSGTRMNVVMLKITDEQPFKRIKSKFMNEIKKLKDYKLEPFKCLALMCSNHYCTEEIQSNILLLFEESFPNLPVLLFSDKIVADIPISEVKDEEDDKLLFRSVTSCEKIAVIRIILILLN